MKAYNPCITLGISNTLILSLLLVSLLLPSGLAQIAPRGGRARRDIVRQGTAILKGYVREILLKQKGAPVTTIREDHPLDGGDSVATRKSASAEILFRNGDVVVLWEESMLEILPYAAGSAASALRQGKARISSAGATEPIALTTPAAAVTHRKTELAIEVEGPLTRVFVIQGDAELYNEHGRVFVPEGGLGVAVEGQAPELVPVLKTNRGVQWWIHVPAVLDATRSSFQMALAGDVSGAWSNYVAGDMISALRSWPGFPNARAPRNDSERLLLASLWLGCGNETESADILSVLPESDALRAIQRLLRIGGTGTGVPAVTVPVSYHSPSELLALSYEFQKSFDWHNALRSAERAFELSPHFGLAAARIAEIHFALGHLEKAEANARNAASLCPLHPTIWIVRGFASLARSDLDEAETFFHRAIALQSTRGDAWLGRGLIRWRRGERELALEDLRTAAAVEPTRSLFHSYLGKVLAELGGEKSHRAAREEFGRARDNDPSDPTPWLYEALLDRAENQPIDGLEKLRESSARNGQRAIFRSRYLLDQDDAVRSANHATMYADIGLLRQAASAAAVAIASDYSDFSSHSFLAGTFNVLRDPRQGDLRYETPWFSEYLLANLLSPPGAGLLSQSVSQNEYSRLIRRDGAGIASRTIYGSNGRWLQGSSQFGAFEDSEFAVDELYRSDPGQFGDRNFEDLTVSIQGKHKVRQNTTLLFQALRYTAAGGDTSRTVDGRSSQPGLAYSESQKPLVLAGLHHEWSPESHTLILGSIFEAELSATNTPTGQYIAGWDPTTQGFTRFRTNVIRGGNAIEYNGYSAEAQHQQQVGRNQFVLGGRYQEADILAQSAYFQPGFLIGLIPDATRYRSRLPTQSMVGSMRRSTAYLHDYLEVSDYLTLIGGLSFEHLRFPENFRSIPVTPGHRELQRWVPSAGWVSRPFSNAVFRGAWTHSLSGVSLEQSLRLEPSQIAGFPHAYRSLLPSQAPAQWMTTRSVAWDQMFPKRTFLSVHVEESRAKAVETIGFVAVRSIGEEFASTFDRSQKIQLLRTGMNLDQPWGRQFIAGIRYQYSRSKWRQMPGVSGLDGFQGSSDLHEFGGHVSWFHPFGWFASSECVYLNHQSEMGTFIPRSGTTLFNLGSGWRGFQRRVEIAARLENIGDTRFRLDPSLGFGEPTFVRTFVISARLQF